MVEIEMILFIIFNLISVEVFHDTRKAALKVTIQMEYFFNHNYHSNTGVEN